MKNKKYIIFLLGFLVFLVVFQAKISLAWDDCGDDCEAHIGWEGIYCEAEWDGCEVNGRVQGNCCCYLVDCAFIGNPLNWCDCTYYMKDCDNECPAYISGQNCYYDGVATCTGSGWSCSYKRDSPKPSCSSYCIWDSYPPFLYWRHNRQARCSDAQNGWYCSSGSQTQCTSSGCCEHSCNDATGCYEYGIDSRCPQGSYGGMCQSDCTCCLNECAEGSTNCAPGNVRERCRTDVDSDPCTEWDSYDCDNSDGCYVYGNGCEMRNYRCSGGSCVYSTSNRNTDWCTSWSYYCSGNDRRRTRTCHDYYCDGGCTDHVSNPDQFVEDCDNLDGWNYCTGNVAENRDYSCSGGSCTYVVVDSYDCDQDDGCSGGQFLDDWSCNSGSCVNNQVDCSESCTPAGYCNCYGYGIEENSVNTYSVDPTNNRTDPTGNENNTWDDGIDNDCDDCTDTNDKDVDDALCTGECDYCVDENGGGYSDICDHDDIFCDGSEGHCFCDVTDGWCKDCSDYYGGDFCGYEDCAANHPPKNPNTYDMFPTWTCDPMESGEDRCDYSCVVCCEGCNCVNITLDAVYISTKTMVENTIEINMSNDDPTTDIPVELFVENEDDLKTCFGKRCEKWNYYFVNSTGFKFHPDYTWPAINYVPYGVPPGGGAIAYFNFTPSGPTPPDLYEIEIGVRNPSWIGGNEDPDGDGVETCPPRIS